MIQVGDRLPGGTLRTMTEEGVAVLNPQELFAGGRAVLFGVPAVFTPGCTRIHLPSYLDNFEAIRAKGFDLIACMSVSDAWVMHAWSEHAGATGKIKMLADDGAQYATALGIEFDLTQVGMGFRCKRFSMVIDDGIVESINIDERAIDVTGAAYTCGLQDGP